MQTETVTRLRAVTTVDPYSNQPAPDWTQTPTELDITTLAPAEPRPSGEPLQDARNQVTSGWTLYLPEGSDVTSVDRMRVRGVVFDVLGDPAAWLGAGLVVQLERSEG
jgi:hypothetical protein